MKILKKILMGICIAVGAMIVVFIVSALGILLMIMSISPPPVRGTSAMEKEFEKSKEAILVVRDYLAELEFESIYIPDPDGMMSTENGEIAIKNDKAVESIQLLFNNGYQVIEKGAECIDFLRWSNLDRGTGTVYTMTGRVPTSDSLPFLTKLEPMSEDGWYYYEEDFNEYRRHRQADQK